MNPKGCLKLSLSVAFTLLLAAIPLHAVMTSSNPGPLDFTVERIDGAPVDLSQYRGKVLLIVNVASKCGFTPQYEGLEALHEKFGSAGLAVLGFPANDFGEQEPGSNQEIQEFCRTNYGVKFDMMSKIHVKGPEQHPLYQLLTSDPQFAGEVRWNFEKFLVSREGKIVARFDSRVEPLSEQLVQAIQKELQAD